MKRVQVVVYRPRGIHVDIVVVSDDDEEEGAAVVPVSRAAPALSADLPPATIIGRKQPRDAALVVREGKRKREDAPSDAPLPPRQLPRLDIAALQQLITPHTRVKNTHPRHARIRTVFTDVLHEYYVDEQLLTRKEHWYSPSGLSEGVLFPVFDTDGVAARTSENSKTGKYAGMTTDEVKESFKQAGVKGSAWHAAFDAWLQHDPMPADAMEPPPSFYQCMAEVLKDWDVWSTEQAIFDEDRNFYGTFDIVFVHRATGILRLGDFKTFSKTDDQMAAEHDYGIHPFTWGNRHSKYYQTAIQVSFYREILLRKYGYKRAIIPRDAPQRANYNDNLRAPLPSWPRKSIEPLITDSCSAEDVRMDRIIWILNFPSDRPYDYRIYEIEALDMAPLWSLAPINLDDPRQYQSLTPAYVPRYDGAPASLPAHPAMRWRVPVGGLADDMVWVGALYPSAKARADMAKKKAAGEEYDDKLARFDLAKSPFNHPWGYQEKDETNRRQSAAYYEHYLLNSPALLDQLPSLYGKRLCCWCRDTDPPCYVSVLAKYTNLHQQRLLQFPRTLLDDYFGAKKPPATENEIKNSA
jgi:hypothetical protein